MTKDYTPLFEQHCSEIKSTGEGWYSAWCPFHEQGGKSNGHKTPSFSFNEGSGGWKCWSCHKRGNAIDFAGLNSIPNYDPMDRGSKNQAMVEVNKVLPWFDVQGVGAGVPVEKQKGRKATLPSPTQIEEHCTDLLSNKTALDYLLKYRGWTPQVISDFDIGITKDERHFVIPIYTGGHLVNVRFYSPKGEVPWDQNAMKIRGIKGRNEVRIFPDKVLESGTRTVYLVEGEGDALAAISAGLNAITFTGGAGNTPTDLHRLKDHEVVILYDNDEAGRAGSKKVAQTLRKYTQQIKILDLEEVCPGSGDLTDSVVKIGHEELLKQVTTKEKQSDFQPSTIIRHVHVRDVGFDEAINSTNIGARIKIKAMVMGTRERPYAAYSRVSAVCDSAGTKPFCSICPLSNGHCCYPTSDQERLTEKDMLGQIRKTDAKVRSSLKVACGFLCDDFELNEINSQIESIYELVIGPYHDDAQEESVGFQQRTVFACNNGKQYRINQPYLFEGVTTPQPWDQANTHFFTKHEEIERTVDEFKLSAEDKDRLSIFKVETTS